MKHVENSVNEILHSIPETRDDDNLLMACYLKTLEEDFSEIELALVTKRIATRFKTVERARRKLQADNPLIRGEAWHRRHGEAQDAYIQYSLDLN